MLSLTIATVAVVCTMSECHDYVIDTADNYADAELNLNTKGQEFSKAWNETENEGPLTKWLGKYQVGLTVFEVVSVDIENHYYNEEMIP